MKIDSIPGEFGFKALYNDQGAWLLTDSYFLNKEAAEKFFADRVPAQFIWPVEEHPETGMVYIPDEDELR